MSSYEPPRGMAAVWRYVKLYYWYLRANWLSLMAYPVEFIIVNLSGVAYSLGSVAAVWVLFAQVKAIGRWTYPEVLLIYGMSIFSRSLFHLFWINLMTLSSMVRDGTVDRLLVRPLNPLFQVVAGYLDNDDWGELVTAIMLVWISLGMLGQRTAWAILWVLLSVIWVVDFRFYAPGWQRRIVFHHKAAVFQVGRTMDEFTNTRWTYMADNQDHYMGAACCFCCFYPDNLFSATSR